MADNKHYQSNPTGGLPILLVAAGALIRGDGRILLACRPKGRPMAGLWEFPGGKVKDSETPEDALCRELAEELGINVDRKDLRPIAFASHPYPEFHLLMPLFLCRDWQGDPVPQEGQEIRWVTIAKMLGLAMPPADKPLVGELRKLLS